MPVSANEAYAWECNAINAERKAKRLEVKNEKLRAALSHIEAISQATLDMDTPPIPTLRDIITLCASTLNG